MGDEDRVDVRQPDAAQQLVLGALAAVEQDPLAARAQQQRGQAAPRRGTEPAVPAKNSDRSMDDREASAAGPAMRGQRERRRASGSVRQAAIRRRGSSLAARRPPPGRRRPGRRAISTGDEREHAWRCRRDAVARCTSASAADGTRDGAAEDRAAGMGAGGGDDVARRRSARTSACCPAGSSAAGSDVVDGQPGGRERDRTSSSRARPSASVTIRGVRCRRGAESRRAGRDGASRPPSHDGRARARRPHGQRSMAEELTNIIHEAAFRRRLRRFVGHARPCERANGRRNLARLDEPRDRFVEHRAGAGRRGSSSAARCRCLC